MEFSIRTQVIVIVTVDSGSLYFSIFKNKHNSSVPRYLKEEGLAKVLEHHVLSTLVLDQIYIFVGHNYIQSIIIFHWQFLSIINCTHDKDLRIVSLNSSLEQASCSS